MSDERIDVFITKKNGRLISVEVSLRTIKLMVVLILLLSASVVVLSYLYISLFSRMEALKRELAKVSSQVKVLSESRNYAETAALSQEEQEEYSQRAALENIKLEEIDKGIVKVEDIKKLVRDGKVRISFWLYTLQKGKKTSGYLFAAVLNENNMAYFYPLGANFLLENFELYKDGIFFSIYYRRNVVIDIDGFEGKPEKLIVCVYDPNGEKILQKTYEL